MSSAMVMPSSTPSFDTLSFLLAECIHCGRGGRVCVEPRLVPLCKGFARLSGCPRWVPAMDTSQATSRMSVSDLILPFSNRYQIC